MARVPNNPILKGASGRMGNIVFKQYASGTFMTAAPDRSKVKLSKKQKKANSRFTEAVQYAQSVLKDPKKREAYEAKRIPGKSVYHTALAEYLSKK